MFNNSNGLPGAYLGVQSPTPPNFQQKDRLPTPNDWQGYVVGAEWLYVPSQYVATGRRLFRLFSLVGNQALWVEETAGGGTVISLSGNDNIKVLPDGTGNIKIQTAGSTVQVLGTPVSFLESINFGLTNLLLGSSGSSIAGAVRNVGLGEQALQDLTTGMDNVGIGFQSLLSNTSGTENTAVGSLSADVLTTGSENTAIGYGAYSGATNASGNIAIGVTALSGAVVSPAANNLAIGNESLLLLTTGSDNVALGDHSLSALTTGGTNIALGVLAGSAITTTSNNINIGHPGIVADANTIRIGISGSGTGQQNKTFIAGIAGVTVPGNLNFVTIDTATGQLGSEAGGGGGPITSVTTSNATPQFVLTGSVENIDFAATTNLLLGSKGIDISSGTDNTGLGVTAIGLVSSGSFNSAFGSNALGDLNTGSDNTAIGAGALSNLTSGTNNIAIGFDAGSAYTTESANIILGNVPGFAGDSLVTRIANIYGTSVGVVNSTVVIDNTGQLGTSGTSGTPIEKIQGDSGGALAPTAGTFIFTGGTTGLTFAGSSAPATETLTGVLVPANGGTGNNDADYTADGVFYWDGTEFQTTDAGNAGQVLTSNGAGMAPTWQAGGGSGSGSGIIGFSSLQMNLTSGLGYTSFWDNTATASSSEPGTEVPVPSNGTISRLYVDIFTNANTAAGTYTLYVNGAPTSLVATVPASTTGIFSDTTHSVNVSAGDEINIVASQATAGVTLGSLSALYSATSSGSSSIVPFELIGPNATIDNWGPYSDRGGMAWPSSGVFSTLYLSVQTNNSTDPITFTLFVNGSATAITITVSANTTGVFTDLVDTAAISAGQVFQLQTSATSLGASVTANATMIFTS